MEKPARNERLSWAQSAGENRQVVERYDAWAKHYDKDLWSYGYRSPALMAGFISRYVKPESGPILDAGCGTGMLADILHVLGYKDIVGIDMSTGMLHEAEGLGLYRELRRMVLGEHLDFEDDTFAAFVAMSVLVEHPPARSLDELIRVTRPGGYGIFTMKLDTYINKGFKDKQELLEREGKWKLVEATEEYSSVPLLDKARKRSVFVYRIQ